MAKKAKSVAFSSSPSPLASNHPSPYPYPFSSFKSNPHTLSRFSSFRSNNPSLSSFTSFKSNHPSLSSVSSFKTMHRSRFSFSSLPDSIPDETFTQSMMEETVESAESIIKKWDMNSPSYSKIISLFIHSRKEAKEFITCIRKLRSAMNFLVSEDSQSPKLVLAQNLMQIGMATLEKEFFQILSSNRDQLDPESVSAQTSISSNSEFEDLMNSDYKDDDEDYELKKAGESISKVEKTAALVMSDLKVIAETMISCGYGKECIKSYKMIRKSIVDEGLHLLGIEKCNTSKFHRMDWSVAEPMIKNWIKAAKIAVTTLFRGEKLLCDHVFSSSSTIRETCFHEIANEAGITLLKFPELVATKEKKSWPERMFKLMDLCAAISELRPEIEMIFHFDSDTSVKTLVHSSLKKLEDLIHASLKEFESRIQKDSSKALTPGGGIHTLTRSTMSFISSLSEYSHVLSEILAEHPLKKNTSLVESYFTAPIFEDDHNNRAVSVYLAWLILIFLCKLDTKAESYKDVALSYLFLVNNLHFVVDTVRSSHLRNILGVDWLTKHDAKLRCYIANYEIVAWANVYLSLPEKSNETLSPEEAIACFKRFHVVFEEAYTKQSSCVITDVKLKEELQDSIAKKLVPEYREFYSKYLPILSQEKNIAMLVRLKPDDLENYIADLFHGTPIVT